MNSEDQQKLDAYHAENTFLLEKCKALQAELAAEQAGRMEMEAFIAIGNRRNGLGHLICGPCMAIQHVEGRGYRAYRNVRPIGTVAESPWGGSEFEVFKWVAANWLTAEKGGGGG